MEVSDDVGARLAKLRSECDAIKDVTMLENELLLSWANAIEVELEHLLKESTRIQSSLRIFRECELEPLGDELSLLKEYRTAIEQRSIYLDLWLKGETTAPALEVLLYFVVPISHLETLAGDLEQEYRTSQLPRLGPRAAQWWYTKQVLKTIQCYTAWACKHTSVAITVAKLLRRIVHWIGL
jgi:hypothetical protein